MRTMTKAALMGATMLGLATTANAEIINEQYLDRNDTIVENAAKVQNFSTLVAAVEAAGLADALMGDGPYTIFAPLDTAFADLPAGTVETLLEPENREQLATILQAHVIPGAYTSEELIALFSAAPNNAGDDFDGRLNVIDATTFAVPTINDRQLQIERVNDRLAVSLGDDAEEIRVVEGDIVSSNGVIHVIDGVLIPQM
ncbi:fasciclin domain-containing protein [Aestuariibius sp. 2305UL40-4]|uniref:fasciclin domain-containing protein n=1 Tax=Aestuariibius violaceus TaxID=3234132 RepID=UPI00345E624C